MSKATAKAKRDLKQAVLRGLALRCPACGRGHLFAGYLKQAHCCSECWERTGDIRADDGPAWATILLVGHLVSPLFIVFAAREPSLGSFLILAGLCVAASLALLPRMKGLFIGLIWASHAGEATAAD